LLERLALHRPELRAWALYDWANSAMITVIVTAVYPIYFSKVAADGLSQVEATSMHGRATVIALLCAAILAPLLGAVADRRSLRVDLGRPTQERQRRERRVVRLPPTEALVVLRHAR